MVAIRCSIRMEVPLGQTGEVVVSPEYVRYLVRIANSKMEANKKRMDGFLDLLQTKVLSYFEIIYLWLLADIIFLIVFLALLLTFLLRVCMANICLEYLDIMQVLKCF